MPRLKNIARPVFYAARALWLRGGRRHCVLCGGSFRRFLPKGDPVRLEAMCPGCLSLERHRLLWLFLEHAGLFTGATSLLHFAPEPALRHRLRTLPGLRYITADIAPGRGQVAVDIARLGFLPEAFEAILCCHVLEHIPDDRAAMRELFRVLRPGGKAVLQVPLREGPTDEDLSVTDPVERLRRFGQEDHLRLYGRADFVARLQAAGFEVEAVAYGETFSAAEQARMRLRDGSPDEDWIFIARRPESSSSATSPAGFPA